MQQSVELISFPHLTLAFIPVLGVIWISWLWRSGAKTASYALSRMLFQLLLIGYFLSYLFESDSALLIITVLSVMLISASWIALRTVDLPRGQIFVKTLIAIGLSGALVLILITQFVLDLQPWYSPSLMIALAGMIFAAAMNSVSLAGERIAAEMARGLGFVEARAIAFQAAMIPVVNSLFAVGLVSLPGMMTGQILSGVSPLIAVRYQIVVMCMIFAASGLAAAIFLQLLKPLFRRQILRSIDDV